MGRAYAIEQSPAARDAIAQILTNSRLCAEGHRPICQDTGIVVVFVQVGMGVRWDAVAASRCDDQRRRAARLSRSGQQAARVHRVRSRLQARQHARQHAGGDPHRARARESGSTSRSPPRAAAPRTKSMFAMLNPSDSVADWVVDGGAGDGRRLVPAGHARRRHRRQRREGHAARQEIVDGAHRHRRARRRAARALRSRSCASRSTGASTISAWARRVSAASPPCST